MTLTTIAILLLVCWKFADVILQFDGPLNKLFKRFGLQSQEKGHEFVGKEAIVSIPFAAEHDRIVGKVEFLGSTWNACLEEGSPQPNVGAAVSIVGIKGLTLLVKANRVDPHYK